MLGAVANPRFAKGGEIWTAEPRPFGYGREIREKLLDGFRPIDWGDTEPPPHDPELAALIANPAATDDDWLVHGDRLEARGDPRGSRRAIQHRRALAPHDEELRIEERRLLADHRAAWLGPLAEIDASYLHLEWRLGFVRGARLHRTTYLEQLPCPEEILWCLLSARFAPLLERLAFGLIEWGDQDNQAICALLMDPPAGPPPLRSLKIGAFGDDDLLDRGEIDISRAWLSSLVRLPALYPALEELELTGRLNSRGVEPLLGAIELPALRRFAFRTGGLPTEHMAEIRDARWPRLEELDLWFGDSDYGGDCTLDDVLPLLDGRVALPALRRLGLRNTTFADELCEPLLRSPLLPQLTALDLSLGVLTDDGAELLARGADRLAHLERVVVRENCLTPAGIARLADTGLPIDAAENDPEFRYVSVSE
jgi:hypothetical protein